MNRLDVPRDDVDEERTGRPARQSGGPETDADGRPDTALAPRAQRFAALVLLAAVGCWPRCWCRCPRGATRRAGSCPSRRCSTRSSSWSSRSSRRRLRLRQGRAHDRRLRRRTPADGRGAEGHDPVPRAGLHPRPVHRALRLVGGRLRARGGGRRRAQVGRLHRAAGDLPLRAAVLAAQPVHRVRVVDVDADGGGVRADVRDPRLRAGVHPGGVPDRRLGDPDHHPAEPVHDRAAHLRRAATSRTPGSAR